MLKRKLLLNLLVEMNVRWMWSEEEESKFIPSQTSWYIWFQSENVCVRAANKLVLVQRKQKFNLQNFAEITAYKQIVDNGIDLFYIP